MTMSYDSPWAGECAVFSFCSPPTHCLSHHISVNRTSRHKDSLWIGGSLFTIRPIFVLLWTWLCVMHTNANVYYMNEISFWMKQAIFVGLFWNGPADMYYMNSKRFSHGQCHKCPYEPNSYTFKWTKMSCFLCHQNIYLYYVILVNILKCSVKSNLSLK